jgi:uncharacterized membrane protein
MVDKNPKKLINRSYLFTNNNAWYWIIIALTIITATLVFTATENLYLAFYARHTMGSIFVLFLPGYSLLRALLPDREMDDIERIALSIGISLAIVPMTLLLINYTPWSISEKTITISLLLLTIAFATSALIREKRVSVK